MKVVYLILYLWHGGYRGGPAITVSPMPSMVACEAIGIQAKRLADEQIDTPEFRHLQVLISTRGLPAVYRCIEVPK